MKLIETISVLKLFSKDSMNLLMLKEIGFSLMIRTTEKIYSSKFLWLLLVNLLFSVKLKDSKKVWLILTVTSWSILLIWFGITLGSGNMTKKWNTPTELIDLYQLKSPFTTEDNMVSNYFLYSKINSGIMFLGIISETLTTLSKIDLL